VLKLRIAIQPLTQGLKKFSSLNSYSLTIVHLSDSPGSQTFYLPGHHNKACIFADGILKQIQ
jgi:hypothetical protein